MSTDGIRDRVFPEDGIAHTRRGYWPPLRDLQCSGLGASVFAGQHNEEIHRNKRLVGSYGTSGIAGRQGFTAEFSHGNLLIYLATVKKETGRSLIAVGGLDEKGCRVPLFLESRQMNGDLFHWATRRSCHTQMCRRIRHLRRPKGARLKNF
ncbi:hypothetical protein C8R44DRAFT_738997 [Mycena epipterygia]|nr:hypothetical protein C8R44DRAFT_738997 [Mycena epipterygia]